MRSLTTLQRDRTQNRILFLLIAFLSANVDAAADKVR
jgi:hypothetical protein